MKACVYGGQFGSEGKGSLAEWLANTRSYVYKDHQLPPGKKLIVAGENSPNSGHTCTMGKTRNIPASSFFADAVLLGPDSVIDFECLKQDIEAINQSRVDQQADEGDLIPVYIHENAAIVMSNDKQLEEQVVERISSTGSGSGFARCQKQFVRTVNRTIKSHYESETVSARFDGYPVRLLNTTQYLSFIDQHKDDDWLFECSQGVMLDVNFGYFPYVTSRTTLPRVAVERNGLGHLDFDFYGVFRTYPIRTGGPSGPTGGDEITFEGLGVEQEIATVTKRKRRIFKFDSCDFSNSLMLARPDFIAFTHLDYIKVAPGDASAFDKWLDQNVVIDATISLLSDTLGQFVRHPLVKQSTLA